MNPTLSLPAPSFEQFPATVATYADGGRIQLLGHWSRAAVQARRPGVPVVFYSGPTSTAEVHALPGVLETVPPLTQEARHTCIRLRIPAEPRNPCEGRNLLDPVTLGHIRCPGTPDSAPRVGC